MPETRQPSAWEAEIQLKDLPGEFRELGRLIGLSALLHIMRHFEGDKVYFPKIDGAFKTVRDAAIHREWKKCRDPRYIGQKFGLTVQQVREIVGDHEDQTALFPPS